MSNAHVDLTKLQRLIPPPSSPAEIGTLQLRASVEKSLGLGLPSDLCDFAMVYGSGAFQAPNWTGLLYIFNPFSPTYLNRISDRARMCVQIKDAEGDEYVPFGIYPERPGLLACGYGEGGRDIYWLTKGEPDEWPILIWPPERKFISVTDSLSSFLLRLFLGKINCWGSDKDATWFKKQPVFTFAPSIPSIPVQTKNAEGKSKGTNRKRGKKK